MFRHRKLVVFVGIVFIFATALRLLLKVRPPHLRYTSTRIHDELPPPTRATPQQRPAAAVAPEPEPAVEGLVLDALDGSPVAAAKVGLLGPLERPDEEEDAEPAAAATGVTASTGSDGRFTLEPAPGVYRLRAEAAGHPPLLGPRFTVAASRRSVFQRVELHRAGELEVLVLDQAGKPQSGAAISDRVGFAGWNARVEGKSGEDGLVLLQVPEGRDHHVKARLQDGAQLELQGVAVAAAQRRPVELRFEARVELKGRVRDHSGSLLAGVRVEGAPAPLFLKTAVQGQLSTAQAETGPDGLFVLHVPNGPQQLTLSLGGYSSLQVNATPSGALLELVLERAARVTGRLLDRNTGEPLRGGRVRGLQGGVARCDERGSYTLEASLDERGQIQLSGSAPGYQPAETTLASVKAGEERPGIDLRLARAGTLRGLVVDALAGSPVAGAQVVLGSGQERESFLTDSSGRFQLSVPGGSASLTAAAQGYAALKLELKLPTDRDSEDLELRLKPVSWIAGRVIDTEGQRIVGAEVRMYWQGRSMQAMARSDTDGGYLLEPVDGARSYTLTATHPNFAAANRQGLRVETGARLRGIDLVMSRGGGVAGLVVTRKGKPVPGATVNASGVGGDPFQQRLAALGRGLSTTTTGANGRFTLRPLRAGAYRVTASGPDIVTESRSVKVKDQALTEGVRIEVREALHLRGRVTDPVGAPVAGVMIQPEALRDAGVAMNWNGRLAAVQTDAEGRYEVGGLEPGRYRIEADLWSRRWTEAQTAEVPGADVDFVVRTAGELGGQVVRALGRAPVGAFAVFLQSAHPAPFPMGPDAEGVPFSTADGRFLLSGLAAGRYDLEVRAAGFAPAQLPGIRLEENQSRRDLLFELHAGASVSGVVLDEDDRPVAGARVGTSESIRSFALDPTRERTATAMCNRAGEFRLDGLPAGLIQLNAFEEGYLATRVNVQLEEGAEREGVEIRLRRGYTVRGTVLSRRGRRPVAGAALGIDLFRTFQLLRATTSSREDGTFEIGAVAPGNHELMVKAPASWLTATRTLDVQSDLENVELVLPAGGTIFGHVVGTDGQPLRDVEVVAIRPAAITAATVTDERGGFAFLELGPGKYSVIASVQGASFQHEIGQPAFLEEGGRVELLLQLQQGVALYGTVSRADGGSVENLLLTLAKSSERLDIFQGDQTLQGGVRLPATGEYRIEGLEPGSYRLKIAKDRDRTKWDLTASLEQSIDIGQTDLRHDIEIPAPARIRGTVADAGGRPLAGTKVELFRLKEGESEAPVGSQSLAAVPVDQDGAYEMEGVPPGNFELRAVKQGFATQSVQVRTLDGALLQQDFTLRKGGVLWGHVLDTSGQALDTARLHVRRNGGLRVTEQALVPDEQGNYVVGGLPSDDYYLTAVAVGLAPSSAPATVRFGGEDSAQVDFRLGPGGTLRITARDAAGAPLSGREIQIQQLFGGVGLAITSLSVWGSDRPAAYVTDGKGVCEARLLEPGSYLVRNMGEAWDEQQVQVQEGQTAEVLLQLERPR